VSQHLTPGRFLVYTFIHPRQAFVRLENDPRGRRFAAVALATVALLYSVVEWLLYRARYDPILAPVLRISDTHYYAWAALLGVPVFLGGWLISSAAVQLVARGLGGRGRYEDLATALAWATGVATLFTLVPDLVGSAFGFYGTSSPIVFAALYLVASIVLYSGAVRTVHGLGWRAAVPLGVGGFVLHQLVLLLVLR
jgi:hypothetical protein